MKKLTLFLMSAIITLFGSSCSIVEYNNESSEQTSDFSKEENTSVAESDIPNDDESVFDAEDVYEFLKSDYYVISKKKTHETVFVCKYYFVDKVVAGTVLMTTLPNEKTALEYYREVLDEYPDAELNKLTVTVYNGDEDAYYYGYSLEKLLFVLKNAGYETALSFDKNEFYDESSDQSAE